MTVLENVSLGLDKAEDRRALAARVREVSQAYGLPLDPERDVYTLSVGERQRIEIVRRSEEHTSELQSLMRISYAVFCLKKKTKHHNEHDIILYNSQS